MNETAVLEQLAAHSARNERLVATILAKGIDPGAKRTVDLFFYSQSEANAVTLAASLQERIAARVSVAPSSGASGEWCVEAAVQSTVELVASARYTESLVRLAHAHDSEYDGWGTEV